MRTHDVGKAEIISNHLTKELETACRLLGPKGAIPRSTAGGALRSYEGPAYYVLHLRAHYTFDMQM